VNEMPIFDVGRICVKLAGREAGRRCIIVDKLDKNYVVISGLRVKRRRVNLKQLEPTNAMVKISKGISDEELLKVLQSENKIELMKEKIKIKV